MINADGDEVPDNEGSDFGIGVVIFTLGWFGFWGIMAMVAGG